MDSTKALAHNALKQSHGSVLWLDNADRPELTEEFLGSDQADLVVVGAGFTGLWAALQAKEENPSLEVVVIDSGRIGEQASSRNGGFLSATLTHGLANGVVRFPEQIDQLVNLGQENLDGLVTSLQTHQIDARLEMTGNLIVADAPWQVDAISDFVDLLRAHGEQAELLDRQQTRAELNSPTYLAGAQVRSGEGLVDPARLAWGLAVTCRKLGVRIYENTKMLSLKRSGAGVSVMAQTAAAPSSEIRTNAVLLGTGAFASPVKAINRRVIPVYDYVLATEPLSGEQMDSIGWRDRQGVADSSNQFHYYRLTQDNRIVWGGYDAVFHNWGKLDPKLDQRPESHQRLAEHFFRTFPQLEGVQFTHRWGGVIDTSTRFSVGFGTALDGRVAYAVGYTGLGVGATRFGARVCLDLLFHPDSELLKLDLVGKKLLPFPPEPIRTAGIQYTRRAIAKADARNGRRGVWLRTLDALGLGFDS
ncbi:MAG: FAD-dependent oxidoreductase [Actinomycetes bacterium]